MTQEEITKNVEHPAHYKREGKECIECMEDTYGKIAVYIFCILNAYKYRFRAGNKENNPEEQDMQKAKWYEGYAYRVITRMNSIQRLILKLLKV